MIDGLYDDKMNEEKTVSFARGLSMYVFSKKSDVVPVEAHVFISDRGKVGPAFYWKTRNGAKDAGLQKYGFIKLLEIKKVLLHLSKGTCETPIRPYLELLPESKTFECGVNAMRVSLGSSGEAALHKFGNRAQECNCSCTQIR